ncbi:MAG: hypothetical protein JWO95_2893 [Verrucomicrobiales bacterium]|nr:hypothetical protein [Verrucomicrobiales bacterium]
MDINVTARDLVAEKLKKAGRTAPQEVVDQMAADLADRLEDTVNAAILDSIPSGLHGEFSKALDEGRHIDFLAKNAPDVDARIRDAVTKFSANYLGR